MAGQAAQAAGGASSGDIFGSILALLLGGDGEEAAATASAAAEEATQATALAGSALALVMGRPLVGQAMRADLAELADDAAQADDMPEDAAELADAAVAWLLAGGPPRPQPADAQVSETGDAMAEDGVDPAAPRAAAPAPADDAELLDPSAEGDADLAERANDPARAGKTEFLTEWRRLASAARMEVSEATQALKAQAEGASAAAPSHTTKTAFALDGDDAGAALRTDFSAFVRTGAPDAVTANARTDHAGAQAQARPATPADQVAFQVARAAPGLSETITIQLHPRELGRVHVRLELGDDGPVRAVISVDRPETLDLLQRDARALERALNSAGLETDDQSLSFDLNDRGANTGQPGEQAADQAAEDGDRAELDEAAPHAAAQPNTLLPGSLAWGRLDTARINVMI